MVISENAQPFDVTKAVDLTDSQIAATWVDLSGGGFLQLVDPRSPMPLMLLGGKGSGRTHLMRYYSYALQKIRAGSRPLVEFIRECGYIGIYMRCEGLNAGRFDGKGQSADVWSGIFAYYMDLWIAQLVVQTFVDVLKGSRDFARREARVVGEVVALFDGFVQVSEPSLAGLLRLFEGLRRKVDLAVNNAALTRDLGDLRIEITRGRLVFGVPKILARHFDVLDGVQVAYLIDELENLTSSQQEYVNTLIREKELPCTFKVGSRLYGFRTQKTLSAGEENRVGSEFELVLLDDQLRKDDRYSAFARHLVARRLRSVGYLAGEADVENARLDSLFETYPDSLFESSQTQFVLNNYKSSAERPWNVKLRGQLDEFWRRGDAPGVSSSAHVTKVMKAVACVEYPLLEKLNVFLLYQDWAAKKDLVAASRNIEQGCRNLVQGKGDRSRHEHVLSHFKTDLLAQLLRETKQKQRYLGLGAFVEMSSGLPRHLLIVLKFVHRWALFLGEQPFAVRPVSVAAQYEGVAQAANWFFDDARTTGSDVEMTQSSVERLANFMRRLRYSDKPVESSLTTFSFDEAAAEPLAVQRIRNAHSMSLLLRVSSGAKDRNSDAVVEKYQLNPMLCPRYDLPLARRGTIPLSPSEIAAIFGADTAKFESVVAARLSRMNAPFERSKRNKSESAQSVLPGLE